MRERLVQRISPLYVFAFIASALISLWVNIRESVINPDAICYLYSAEEFGKSGLHGAMKLCPQAIWPFYSGFIYAFEQLTHLSYTTAAFTLDGFFSAISVVLFIAIVKELGGTRLTLWLAALVILLAHEFNILRQDIIRDHGFWAFYLASVWLLLRYVRRPTWRGALTWSASLFAATIFRIEGAVFLLLMPLAVWFDGQVSFKSRAYHFFMLNLPILLIMFGLGVWFATHAQQSMSQFGRVAEVSHQIQNGFRIIFEQYQLMKASIAENILSHNSLRDAGEVTLLLLISWYVVNVVGNLSLIYAALVAYAWVTRAATFTRAAKIIVMGYLLVNVTITFGFFAQNHFLAKRYLIALSLILMLWVPFALARLAELKRWLVYYVAIALIVISSLGGLFHFGHSKDYIRQAGDWMAANISRDAKLYSNDYQLMYYSQHFGSHIFDMQRQYNDVAVIAHGQWKQYDYLALLMGRTQDNKVAMVMQEIHLVPLQVFVSDNGDHIYIYKVSHQEK